MPHTALNSPHTRPYTTFSQELASLSRDLIIIAVLSVLFLLDITLNLFGVKIDFLQNVWLQLILAGIIQTYVIIRFVRILKNNAVNSDILVTLATVIAFLLGVYNGFFVLNIEVSTKMSKLFFETSAIVSAAGMFGKYLQYVALSQTNDVIDRLQNIAPKTAHVRRLSDEIDIPTENIKVGDTLIVHSGEKIPADGVILNGLTSVDEFMITGDSLPVAKQQGDRVIGSTISKLGTFEMRAEKVGDDAALSQIIRVINEAQCSKSTLQKQAESTYKVFVAIAIIASTIALLGWWLLGKDVNRALTSMVSVLVVVCPCALIRASNGSTAAGILKAAQNGVLFRDSEHFHATSKIDTILLDKSGTITKGTPEVIEVIAFNGFFEEEIITFAAAAEKNSKHPIARAIYSHTQPNIIMGGLSEATVRSAENEFVALHSSQHGFIGSSLPPTEAFEAVAGLGICAVIAGGRTVLVGNRGLMRESRIDFKQYEKVLVELEMHGKTVILVAIGGKAAGIIALADTLKESTHDAINTLKKLCIDIYMLTGDSKHTSNTIGKLVGIKNIIAEVVPESKVNGIVKLRASGKTIAMVGDGIKDSKALQAANIGISIGVGTDILSKMSDITSIRDELSSIPFAIELSRVVVKKIKRNTLCICVYNLFCMAVAALGLFHPIYAGVLAAFFSAMLVKNSISLRKFGA